MCALSLGPRTLALWTKPSRATCAQNGAPMYSEPRSLWKITSPYALRACTAIAESGQIVPDLLEVLRVMTFRAHRPFEDGWR